MKIIERIINVQTNEIEEIERDATTAELEEIKKAQEKAAKQLAAFQAIEKETADKAAARAEILAKLGLTEDEAKLLLN